MKEAAIGLHSIKPTQQIQTMPAGDQVTAGHPHCKERHGGRDHAPQGVARQPSTAGQYHHCQQVTPVACQQKHCVQLHQTYGAEQRADDQTVAYGCLWQHRQNEPCKYPEQEKVHGLRHEERRVGRHRSEQADEGQPQCKARLRVSSRQREDERRGGHEEAGIEHTHATHDVGAANVAASINQEIQKRRYLGFPKRQQPAVEAVGPLITEYRWANAAVAEYQEEEDRRHRRRQAARDNLTVGTAHCHGGRDPEREASQTRAGLLESITRFSVSGMRLEATPESSRIGVHRTASASAMPTHKGNPSQLSWRNAARQAMTCTTVPCSKMDPRPSRPWNLTPFSVDIKAPARRVRFGTR